MGNSSHCVDVCKRVLVHKLSITRLLLPPWNHDGVDDGGGSEYIGNWWNSMYNFLTHFVCVYKDVFVKNGEWVSWEAGGGREDGGR